MLATTSVADLSGAAERACTIRIYQNNSFASGFDNELPSALLLAKQLFQNEMPEAKAMLSSASD